MKSFNDSSPASLATILAIACCSLLASCTRSVEDVMNSIDLTAMPAQHSAAPHASTCQPDSLYAIIEDGRYGFVDYHGHVKIKPRFRAVGTFACGLAPAREAGRYGYIDIHGDWAIPPRFDYATDFSEGLATGYIDSMAYIIDRQGAVLHQGAYTKVGPFRDGLASLTLFTKRWTSSSHLKGLISASGKVLVEPGTREHIALSPTRILVRHPEVGSMTNDSTEFNNWQLINHQGFVIREFTGYDDADGAYNGVLIVMDRTSDWDKDAGSDVFNLNGRKIGQIPNSVLVSTNYVTSFGYIDGWKYNAVGGIEEVWLDRKFQQVTFENVNRIPRPFGRNKFLIDGHGSNDFELLDTVGGLRVITSQSVSAFANHSRYRYTMPNGLWDDPTRTSEDFVVFEQGDGVHVMDHTGRISGSHDFDQHSGIVHFDSLRIVAMTFDESGQYNTLRFYNWTLPHRAKAEYKNVTRVISVRDGIITAEQFERMLLLDLDGHLVWQSQPRAFSYLSLTDFDYRPKVEHSADHRFREDFTIHQLMSKMQMHGLELVSRSPQTLQLIAFASGNSDFFPVVVANLSDDSAKLDVCDGRIGLVMEARRNNQTAWVEIEYLQDSDCGNSYYSLYMPPRALWSYTVCRYSGEIPVECRLKLTVNDNKLLDLRDKTRRQYAIYSNSFTASVNPAQLWRVR